MKWTRWILPAVLVLTTIGCDRVTKRLAMTYLAESSPQSYLHNTIRLEYAENHGAFLSLGSGLPQGVRTALLTFGVSLLLVLVAILAVRRRWTGVPLCGVVLLWAGGVSNLIDRAAHGSVVDFLNVGVGSLRTGIFNVADVAVMLGAVLIIIADVKPFKSSSSVP